MQLIAFSFVQMSLNGTDNKMHRCRKRISVIGCEQTNYIERSKRRVIVGA